MPAAGRYLRELVEVLHEEEPDIWLPNMDSQEGEKLQGYMMLRLRSRVLGHKVLAQSAARAEKIMEETFPLSMLTKLNAMMHQVVDCKTEGEVLQLSRSISAMIVAELEEAQKPPEPPQDPESQDDGDGDGAAGQSGDDQGEAEADGPTPPEGSEDGSGEDSGQHVQALTNLLNADAGQFAGGDIGSMLQEQLDQAAAEAIKSAPSQDRTVFMHTVRPDLPLRAFDESGIKASVNAIRSRTRQWVASRAEEDVTHACAGLTIDPSRLALGRLGKPMFRTATDGEAINTAVHFVLDRSSSMSRQIRDAALAVTASMLAFDDPGLVTQVTAFPWSDEHGNPAVALLKAWHEKAAKMAGRIAGLSAAGGTPMAEAILAAGIDVIRRDEDFKIVFVVCDGGPNDLSATLDVIDQLSKAGIAVMGLGIGVDVSHVFGTQNAASIESLDTLAGAVVRLLKSAHMQHDDRAAA